MDSSIEDIEFLASSGHRTSVLEALLEKPCDRNELYSLTGASSPTMGRILSDFEDRNWIFRDGQTYKLTNLGRFVAERFFDLHESMKTERKLRDVWRWLPHEMEEFSVDMFADAVVSYPGPGYPYEPIERVSKLVRETDSYLAFGTTEFKSINLDVVCESVLNGMEFECIYTPEVLEAIVKWNPERVAETLACDNCTILIHDDLPDNRRCGIGIFDERMGICCHNEDTRMLEAVVDTDSEEAIQWAQSVYEKCREEADFIESDEAISSLDLSIENG